jgi:hypothetical protein
MRRALVSETTTPASATEFISSQRVQGRTGRTYERSNPERPNQLVGEFPNSTAEDIERVGDSTDLDTKVRAIVNKTAIAGGPRRNRKGPGRGRHRPRGGL